MGAAAVTDASKSPSNSRANRPPGRLSIGFAIVLGLCAAAPTVGDIGSCNGAPAEPLGAEKFFAARAQLECAHCRDCGLSSQACTIACDPRATLPIAFPEGCHPVVHDGEVCLNALDALSCGAFADVVGPAAVVPTECDFCPPPVLLEAGTTP
jgi:hypothetical protein